jgi:tRNA pseudouridine55 synthase
VNGVLVVDKPVGPTSHDVVARVRKSMRESRVGHTGTLDPAASGVLPLVIGRATRLARFLSAHDKSYETVIRLGVSTDTGDAQGVPSGLPYRGQIPSLPEINTALDGFRGTFLQQPPAHSAKKIAGRRSYKIARERATAGASPDSPAVLPEPVPVTAHAITIVKLEDTALTLVVHCSAGFYVRSLAHDLGAALGTGGHLIALRRVASGTFTLDHAISLDVVERDWPTAAAAIVPMAELLPTFASVVLTPQGVRHAVHGRDLDRADYSAHATPPQAWVRLLDESGNLVGVGEVAKASGLLHPSVVLM